ncbi:PREDICTED: uncharacterized protein LOC104737818 isoform X2 [Camelina sativa]|uniref:Uncharacterized protein LOC104737818 isoform X2 n=1 Tax=Camelina sativa TaxID=90675 RepID=A0ABM0VHW2_CAMSA|nr:PREDICTED: uncharacterized protein LOC104737818 isoform X2 [Camelina sativa]
MVLVIMSLLHLLFSITLVRSDQATLPFTSFKIIGNVTYDCIDIYKQPGLDHPLLKNHTIQIAGVKQHGGPYHGITAWHDGYNLDIKQDQASYSQMYLGSGYYGEVNFISVGMMINPSIFGDGRLWSYGYWKGKNEKGCYNMACPGFVQVSSMVPMVQPFKFKPGDKEVLQWSITKDQQTGNWWIIQNKPNAFIGYWPKELFHLMDDGANMVGVGGVVQASPSGLSPPMGNGKFPAHGPLRAALFSNVDVLNSKYEKRRINTLPVEELLDSKCYGLRVGKRVKFWTTPLGFFFNYGGPGGISCGV